MKIYRTWVVCDPKRAAVIEGISFPDGIILKTQDDPSFRHWFSQNGQIRLIQEIEVSKKEEENLSERYIRGKEILIYCKNIESADNFLSLMHSGILLGYPETLNFRPTSSTFEAIEQETNFLRKTPFYKWFTYHENAGYGCLIARRAWNNPSIRYALHKWRLSLDLDSFTPHSANPNSGQVFPTAYPNDTYHVRAAFAVIAAFSAIEELGLEVRSSQQKPRFIGVNKDEWNPVVRQDLENRLLKVCVDANEQFEWVLRGEIREIEKELKPYLGAASPWANGKDVRDKTLTIIDAIHYSSLIRNFIAAHKFRSLVGELGPYDVFNTQMIARRLILSSLSVWKKDFNQVAAEDQK